MRSSLGTIARVYGSLLVLGAIGGTLFFLQPTYNAHAQTPCDAADGAREDKQFSDAIEKYLELLEGNLTPPCAIDGLAEIGETKKTAQEVLSAGQQVEQSGSPLASAFYHLALYIDPELKEAQEALDALRTPPPAPAPNLDIARALAAAGFYEEARAEALKQIQAGYKPAEDELADIKPNLEIAKALAKAGFYDEARDAAKEAVQAGATPTDEDLKAIKKPAEPGFWYDFRDWVDKYSPALRDMVIALAVLFASIIVVWRIIPRLYRLTPIPDWLPTTWEWLPTRRWRLNIEAFNKGSTGVDIGEQISGLVEEHLRRFDDSQGRGRATLVTGVVEAPALPADIGTAAPQLKIVEGLINWILPLQQLTLSGRFQVSKAHGTGLTVSLSDTRGKQISNSVTLWADEFGLPESENDKPGEQLLALAEVAAIWTRFQLEGLSVGSHTEKPGAHTGTAPHAGHGHTLAPLGATDWRSYALFRMGARHYKAGDTASAGRLFTDALDADDHNRGAMVGYARIKTDRNEFDDATRLFITARDEIEAEAWARYARAHSRESLTDEKKRDLIRKYAFMRYVPDPNLWLSGRAGLAALSDYRGMNLPKGSPEAEQSSQQALAQANEVVEDIRKMRSGVETQLRGLYFLGVFRKHDKRRRRVTESRIRLLHYLDELLPLIEVMRASISLRLSPVLNVDPYISGFDNLPTRDLNVTYNLACYWAIYADLAGDGAHQIPAGGRSKETAIKKALAYLKTAVAASTDSTNEDLQPNLRYHAWNDPSLAPLIVEAPVEFETTVGPRSPDTLADLAPLGNAFAKALKEAGIETVEDIVLRCQTWLQRVEVAKKTSLSSDLLFEAAVIAEMTRIGGIKVAHARLLRATGRAKSLRAFADARPEAVHAKLEDANRILGAPFANLPRLNQIEFWIETAKKLTPLVHPEPADILVPGAPDQYSDPPAPAISGGQQPGNAS